MMLLWPIAFAALSSLAEKLQQLCPKLRFIVAHGQMRERELEEKMHAFLRGDDDALSPAQQRGLARPLGAMLRAGLDQASFLMAFLLLLNLPLVGLFVKVLELPRWFLLTSKLFAGVCVSILQVYAFLFIALEAGSYEVAVATPEGAAIARNVTVRSSGRASSRWGRRSPSRRRWAAPTATSTPS